MERAANYGEPHSIFPLRVDRCGHCVSDLGLLGRVSVMRDSTGTRVRTIRRAPARIIKITAGSAADGKARLPEMQCIEGVLIFSRGVGIMMASRAATARLFEV